MARKPTFICIGAQKAATTWLYKLLSSHPQVWMPKGKKEIHYFDREILRRPLSWYEDHFDDPSGATTITGEKTPSYGHLKKQSVAFIKRVFPDVKVILILRRPDERAWSHARMEISDYNTRPLATNDIMRCIFHVGTLRNSRLTRYDRMLKTWRRLFPDQQMMVLFHEDIEEQPGAVLERIAAFLEIPICDSWVEQPLSKRIWESPDLGMPRAVRWYLQRRYRALAQRIADEWPVPARQWLGPEPGAVPASVWEKIKTRLIADFATIPFNAGYWCYDVVRDVRMFFRLRGLLRSIRPSGQHVSAPCETAQ